MEIVDATAHLPWKQNKGGPVWGPKGAGGDAQQANPAPDSPPGSGPSDKQGKSGWNVQATVPAIGALDPELKVIIAYLVRALPLSRLSWCKTERELCRGRSSLTDRVCFKEQHANRQAYKQRLQPEERLILCLMPCAGAGEPEPSEEERTCVGWSWPCGTCSARFKEEGWSRLGG